MGWRGRRQWENTLITDLSKALGGIPNSPSRSVEIEKQIIFRLGIILTTRGLLEQEAGAPNQKEEESGGRVRGRRSGANSVIVFCPSKLEQFRKAAALGSLLSLLPPQGVRVSHGASKWKERVHEALWGVSFGGYSKTTSSKK